MTHERPFASQDRRRSPSRSSPTCRRHRTSPPRPPSRRLTSYTTNHTPHITPHVPRRRPFLRSESKSGARPHSPPFVAYLTVSRPLSSVSADNFMPVDNFVSVMTDHATKTRLQTRISSVLRARRACRCHTNTAPPSVGKVKPRPRSGSHNKKARTRARGSRYSPQRWKPFEQQAEQSAGGATQYKSEHQAERMM